AEEETEKVKGLLADIRKAEEKKPAVRVADIEKQLEASSRKKSEQIDSQMTKAIGAAAGGPGAPGAGGAAGTAPAVPGAALPGAVAPGGAGPGGAAPNAPAGSTPPR